MEALYFVEDADFISLKSILAAGILVRLKYQEFKMSKF